MWQVLTGDKEAVSRRSFPRGPAGTRVLEGVLEAPRGPPQWAQAGPREPGACRHSGCCAGPSAGQGTVSLTPPFCSLTSPASSTSKTLVQHPHPPMSLRSHA